MCVKEFGLRLSSVGTFSIPVRSSAAIEVSTSGLSNSDICSRNRDQRTRPFFIAEGGDTFKDDLLISQSVESKLQGL